MIGWLKKLLKKKKEAINPCSTCVHWKSEEENNIKVPLPRNGNRYCEVYKGFTHPNHTCVIYKKERFEATADSIQTPELSLDYDLSIEKSELGDISGEKK